MQPSLLKIKKIEFTKVQIESLSRPMSESQLVEICEVQTFRHQDSATWLVSLTVSFGSNQEIASYTGEVGLIGEFLITSDTIKDDVAENLVNVNGPAILYSAAREMIFSITSRSSGGSWMLPSVTFIDRKKSAIVKEANTPETARA